MNRPFLQRPLPVDSVRCAEALADQPGTLLLHGQRPWQKRARSALLFDPRWTLECALGEAPRYSGDVPSPPPLVSTPVRWPAQLASYWDPTDTSDPIFCGIAGFLGYDLGPARWRIAPPAPAPFALPSIWLGAYDCALVFEDGAPSPQLIVADLRPLVPDTGDSLEDRWERAAQRLTELGTVAIPATPIAAGEIELPSAQWHSEAVHRIQSHLRAGDVYQVNLTAFARARSAARPFAAFLDQARRNPVAFAAYLRTNQATVASHSPERLLRLTGSLAETAPIKGTMAEGPGDSATLAASAKDRAEHIMIVDLCRNDLGVSADYGTVAVRELMAPLRLSRLVHLVSRIEARVPPSRRIELFEALFPGGSVTGAPKRRAMEIIAQVERTARGPYTGSVGFIDRAGHADWNIAIRTAVWQEGLVHFGCGGGIVLDSQPETEYAEAVLKAQSFFDTLEQLGEAQAGLSQTQGAA